MRVPWLERCTGAARSVREGDGYPLNCVKYSHKRELCAGTQSEWIMSRVATKNATLERQTNEFYSAAAGRNSDLPGCTRLKVTGAASTLG